MKDCIIIGRVKPEKTPPGYSEWKWFDDVVSAIEYSLVYYKENERLPDMISLENHLNYQHDQVAASRNGNFIRWSQYQSPVGYDYFNWLSQFCDNNGEDPLLNEHGPDIYEDNILYKDMEDWKKKRKHKNPVMRLTWK